LKRTYGMRNVRNVRMPNALGDVISGISIGIAVADSIGYRAPARRYRSNPKLFKICHVLRVITSFAC